MTNKCSATVYDQTGWGHSYTCSRNGKIEEDGKSWCKQHAPSSAKARAEAATVRYNAKMESFLAPGRELDRLRAVNAKLLSALEYTTAFLSGVIEGERIPTGIKASARVQIEAAREAIEAARK